MMCHENHGHDIGSPRHIKRDSNCVSLKFNFFI
jgi:hypothetical protein